METPNRGPGAAFPSVLLGAAVSAFATIVSAAPQFDEVFRGFGADLPPFVHLIVTKPLALAGMLTVPAALQLAALIWFLTSRLPIARAVAVRLGWMNLGIAAILVGALYYPIFQMGKVI